MRQRSKFKTTQAAASPATAILYVRVSTAKQVASGLGLDDQEARLIAEAERRGISDYVVIRDEGVSAATTKRPGLQKALRLLSSGERNLLMALKLDRIARSVVDTLSIAQLSREQGWAVVILDGAVQFDTATPHGKMMLGMIALMGEWERDMISIRTQDAMAAKRGKGDKGLIGRALETRIVGMYRDDQLSMAKIADRLNDEDIPTAKGGRWYASTIHRVIERA